MTHTAPVYRYRIIVLDARHHGPGRMPGAVLDIVDATGLRALVGVARWSERASRRGLMWGDGPMPPVMLEWYAIGADGELTAIPDPRER